ncbi:transposase, partial [Citrifermentans bremense]|uniref:transposase n=1 Tax=Citrifermentans bremense TaxID=60035 RepID=UPI00384BD854
MARHCPSHAVGIITATLLKESAVKNRFQFQQGLSLNAFLTKYGQEHQCEAAIESARWPEGFVCPNCKGRCHCNYRRGKVKVFQCRICRKQVTLTEGTIFHSTKLP